MESQEIFLKETQFFKLALLKPESKPEWGVMPPQHMVEHLSSLYLFTIEKIKDVRFFDESKLKKNYDYLIRDKKPFHKNVKLPGLQKLQPLKFDSIESAAIILKGFVNDFYAFFENDKSRKTLHPALGMLDFNEWEWILFAHSKHHLMQFGLL